MRVTVEIPDAAWWVLAKRADDRGVKVADLVSGAITSLAAPKARSANRVRPIADEARREELRRYSELHYSVPEIMAATRGQYSRERVVATLADMGISVKRGAA